MHAYANKCLRVYSKNTIIYTHTKKRYAVYKILINIIYPWYSLIIYVGIKVQCGPTQWPIDQSASAARPCPPHVLQLPPLPSDPGGRAGFWAENFVQPHPKLLNARTAIICYIILSYNVIGASFVVHIHTYTCIYILYPYKIIKNLWLEKRKTFLACSQTPLRCFVFWLTVIDWTCPTTLWICPKSPRV